MKIIDFNGGKYLCASCNGYFHASNENKAYYLDTINEYLCYLCRSCLEEHYAELRKILDPKINILV